ncbi:carboxymuconolactone decarboxylase family protein [Patulibacter defluvii]|uniref:carboxymuconolactone decarboxylase family protein n=1 Tax=Patulibacter defluvii TaxID=3095358 RepID=UPI002A75C4A5|nr:carboxymuconolactone decarboxylase family protein [Patulibacter sp. DM4]
MSITTVPTPRISLKSLAPESYRAMAALGRSVTLDPQLRGLVNVRASQINGCAYCVDTDGSEAIAHGEDPRRLAALAAWHDSPFFTPRERAALAVTDAVTRLPDAGLPDDVYAAAREHFDDEELAQLLFAVLVINAWNRIGVPTRMAPPRLAGA